MEQQRDFSGWLLNHYRIGDAFDVYETPLPIDEEVWLTLHSISEVRDRGLDVIGTRQPGLKGISGGRCLANLSRLYASG